MKRKVQGNGDPTKGDILQRRNWSLVFINKYRTCRYRLIAAKCVAKLIGIEHGSLRESLLIISLLLKNFTFPPDIILPRRYESIHFIATR